MFSNTIRILPVFILFSFILWCYPIQAQTYTFCQGDSVKLNALNYVSGDVQWQVSTDSVSWADIPGADSLSYMIYPMSSAYYRLLITDSLCLPPYSTDVKYFEILSLPTPADAGSNQQNVSGSSATLDGNVPVYGTGTWSIEAGPWGEFDNIHAPHATFTGLPDSSYVLRWTISNACGTSYDEVSIGFGPFTCNSILVDSRDGQMYGTVQVSNQCWMADNLNIGQQILLAQNQTDNHVIEKYCYNDSLHYCNMYGGLYQWNEMMQYTTTESTQGICPPGWHIPSDAEWQELEIALGMDSTAANLVNQWRGPGVGSALKQGGSSGVDIKLGGVRWPHGISAFIGEMGYYWASTENGADNGWRRCFNATSNSVGRYDNFSKLYGLSVRCVKD